MAALAITVGQEREERRGLEERLRAAQELEARLREQAAQGFVTGETAAALSLQVRQGGGVTYPNLKGNFDACATVPSWYGIGRRKVIGNA